MKRVKSSFRFTRFELYEGRRKLKDARRSSSKGGVQTNRVKKGCIKGGG
jgi:hypothetical protein